MRSILDWVGFSVDIAILRTFFSQEAFTILAVWEALVSTVLHQRHSAAFEVLLSVHLFIRDRGPCAIRKPFNNIEDYVTMAPNCVATVIDAYACDQWELDRALQAAMNDMFESSPVALLEKLISAGASFENCRTSADRLVKSFARGHRETVDLPLLKFLLEAGAVVDEPLCGDRMNDWPGPDSPVCSTDYILLNWGNSTKSEDLWSLVSLYSDRQQTTVTVPGILEAAQGGQEQLHSYLNARSKPSDIRRKTVLEIALSEASGRGYANVVQSLVQFGVDPNVRMLSRHSPLPRQRWHPVIRAVNSGHFHTLRILVSESSADINFLEDRVDQELDLCSLRNMENSQRGQILQALSAMEISTKCRSRILLCALRPDDCGQPGHEAPDHGFVSQLLEIGLACLDCQQNFAGKTSHILVRAIQEECDVTALDYLVQRDVEIFSGLSADTKRKLLEVTLSQFSRECNEILAFLAQNMEGFRSCAQENVCSLLICLFSRINRPVSRMYRLAQTPSEDECEGESTLKWLLDLGVPWERRLLDGLIEHADDHFMLTMIHSVADVSTIDGRYALHLSIFHGRLNLAVALVERGAQVNDHQGQDRRTALQRACENGAPLWFIRFLVDSGADVNVNASPNSFGQRTALQAACHGGAQLSCISFLIDKGADINAPPFANEFTALQHAAIRGRMNVAGLLLDHGADVNALSGIFKCDQDFRFMRAIDLAAKRSILDMAHFLIAAGARSCRPGRTGFEGAIEIASRQNNVAVASLIQEHADSRSEDPMEAERLWLRANPYACMDNGKIQVASWVAFVKRAGGQNWKDVKDYMKEQLE